nr:hypothetical protein [uncultured Roseateles sp.]
MSAPQAPAAGACNDPRAFPADFVAYEQMLKRGMMSRSEAYAEGRYLRALHGSFTEGMEIGFRKGLSIGERHGRRWGLMFGAATTLTAVLACLGAYLMVTQ